MLKPPCLWYVVQRIPLFKGKRMMVKLKSIRDDKERGEFEFKVFLTKRPDIYPYWDDPGSDEEEVPSDVFFGMKVNVKVESIDSLKKSSGLLVANMTPDNLLFEEKPMPKILLSYVKNLASKDMC